MRMPRWLVLTLLSANVLVVLGAGVFWWVTWPDQTARQFVDVVLAGDRDTAVEMLAAAARTIIPHADEITQGARRCPTYFEYSKPTFMDMVCGRRQLYAGLWGEWEFTMKFGTVSARRHDKVGLSKPCFGGTDTYELFPRGIVEFFDRQSSESFPGLFDLACFNLSEFDSGLREQIDQ
jgi:hypothetical protein